MTTIAQQLKIKEFPFEIKDSKGNRIYCETSDGYWSKTEFESNGNLIYCETSDGYWSKTEFESNGNLIYCEDSDGYILDLRPKTVELTMDEIAKKFGIDVNNLKIKK
jgi:hypothetical protein